jgi:hypothetical protein
LKVDTFICSYWRFCWWGIAWEILALPKLVQNFIHRYRLKATDWLIANCYLQEQILNNSKDLLMRVHAMLCYHAGVFKVKFNRDVNTQLETFKWRVGLIIMGKVREKVSTFSL